MFEKKIVLVTGGTGSFGNYIVHRLLSNSEVSEIRILSRDEKKQYDMNIHYNNNPKLNFFIGDIRDYDRVDEVMKDVNIVYQAAALKHVPVCEKSPFEAVKTNVIGVENIIRASLKHCVEKVICVSTDKAVKPVNVMGMTKAIQERLIINANKSPENKGTILALVRYGNVLLSRGSVVPYFRKLLKENQPITITDVKMTRFLLTLDDAIDLVMYATKYATGGETFVKKAPSTYITKLAEVLCEEANVPFKYDVIGRFPGEKLDEILITEEEMPRAEDCGDYLTIHPWWDTRMFDDFKTEFSSSEMVITDLNLVRELIKKADEKAACVHVEKGEFSKI
ncbi:polysaccharide biosynthesis protein [Ihubacter massiliensis]|uniref:Polysaccharide biosynthesis protein n=1 Tax=Hominibacterium faecale TaxID=2839743 RepID=A0A9J6QY41_9FIRM|nr:MULTISPECIES: polysaccharide biosynthesis protein [Eubacteriales Family XIII. Incertae Sedis]MCO7123752.1 polysaccharide biosynthesis protein [Ihubacter massiliensis]MCU7380407.1 polysaccharide biosynthesis protein [Hominibacterium faecale]